MRIQAEGLRKFYGSIPALNNVSWQAEPGQIIALLGANGAGKSTLLNALAGVLRLDAGRVLFDGEMFVPSRGDLRRRFALLPDLPPVPPHWTPIRFIGTTLKLYGAQSENMRERIIQLLTQLDLLAVAQWSFRQLSRGQVYKSVLAAFIAADPEVWFVDEPFASGMDPRGLNAFKAHAREASKRGRTLIYSTQIIEVAEQFSDRICVVSKGSIVADATPEELCAGTRYEELLADLHETPGHPPSGDAPKP
jgi:ABC-type multidrug transport system ATPase subunit